MTRIARLWAFLAALCFLPGRTEAQPAKVEELSRILATDASYKVRLQAALLLGRLGDRAATAPLVKALGDENKMVRAMAAQSLGKLGAPEAAAPLKALIAREKDSFVRGQAQKALAALGPAPPGGGAPAPGGKARIYLTFGSFGGGTRLADPTLLELLRGALRRELGKLEHVTFSLEPDDERSFARSGRLGFLIDGNVTRLDEGMAGGAVEVNCDVKVMVARWPSKSIILWTSAGAAVQGGSRERDIQNARRDCLDASAGQLGEDLARFFRSQGG